MRKRKRDWPIRVYRYDLQRTTIPEVAWEVARREQAAWNDLVGLGAAVGICTWLAPEVKRLHWWCFDYLAPQLTARHGLAWDAGADVITRYKATWRRLKDGGRPPRIHHGLRRVRFLHRYTGGGWPTVQLLNASSRAQRCRITPSAEPQHWGVTFGLAGAALAGTIHEQRRALLLPMDGYVKQVAWCGEHMRPFGWQWSLHVTVEAPPEEASHNNGDRGWAGLDLGWRVMQEYVRVGVITDQCGATYELQLPFACPNAAERRADKVVTWPALWALAAQRGYQLEDCKAALKSLVPPARQNALRLMRDAGLRRLAEEFSTDRRLRAVIDAWRVDDLRALRQETHLRQRLLRTRNERYRLVAQWLCRSYQTIALEADMDLRRLRQCAEDDTPAIAAGRRYAQMAAVGELRRAIRLAAAKHGTIITGSAAHTTDRCDECGTVCAATTERVAACANGHRRDQDHRASLNLLSQISATNGQENGLRTSPLAVLPQLPEIPEQLRVVVVPCSLE